MAATMRPMKVALILIVNISRRSGFRRLAPCRTSSKDQWAGQHLSHIGSAPSLGERRDSLESDVADADLSLLAEPCLDSRRGELFRFLAVITLRQDRAHVHRAVVE